MCRYYGYPGYPNDFVTNVYIDDVHSRVPMGTKPMMYVQSYHDCLCVWGGRGYYGYPGYPSDFVTNVYIDAIHFRVPMGTKSMMYVQSYYVLSLLDDHKTDAPSPPFNINNDCVATWNYCVAPCLSAPPPLLSL